MVKTLKALYFRKFVLWISFLTLMSFLTACGGRTLEIDTSKQFNINTEPNELFREKTLRDKTVVQSFAFDNENKHIYTLQVMAGDQVVGNETVPASWQKRSLQGDMTLTKLDLEGNQLGHMSLLGFGHGVSLGVENVGEETYIWTEVDAIDDGHTGWGSKLTRFTFEDRGVIEASDETLEKYSPTDNADHMTVNIDQAFGLITVRYRLNNEMRFSVYNLNDFKNKKYDPIYDIVQPEDIQTFQGYASYGHYLYLLEGNSKEYESNGTQGNTYITVIDLKDGKVIEKQFIDVALDLPFREPEGMAISIPDPMNPEKGRLNFGFASEAKEFSSKLINIYYFDQFVND